jgi:hypothetical protein
LAIFWPFFVTRILTKLQLDWENPGMARLPTSQVRFRCTEIPTYGWRQRLAERTGRALAGYERGESTSLFSIAVDMADWD